MKNIVKEQDDLQRQEIAKILSWAYRILPVCYGVIIVIRVFTGNWVTVYSMAAATLVIPIANYYLKKGRIETSLVLLTMSLVLTITVAVTFGNGVHDIGLMAFPVILLISSLMLRNWQQILSFVIVILALIWLALGERYGYYSPNPDLTSSISELIIILVIILVSTLICYQVANNLKNALRSRDREIQLTSNKLAILQKSLDQKIQLTNAVHSQVVESISIIRELLLNQKSQPLKKLPNQLLTIELIHAELYRLELEKELDLENYLNELFESQKASFKDLKKESFEDVMINVDQAMSIGMLFTELGMENHLVGTLNVSIANDYVNLKITSPSLPLNLSMLSEIMIRQLSAEIVQTDETFLLSFQHTPRN